MAGHVGLAEDDPRNAGPIDAFRPEDITPDELQARFEAAADRVGQPISRERLLARAAKVRAAGCAPPPPLIRIPGDFGWEELKYAAHPDWVVFIRNADRTLPATCLCLFYGRPTLIHPRTGVIFAVAVGSIGVVARLPRDPPGAPHDYDLARLGPDWRFVSRGTEWAGRAFEHAALEGAGVRR
jgi:hypothetical protein